MNPLKTLMLVAVLALGWATSLAGAADKLVLTDGTEITGTIAQEVDGYVYFTYLKSGIEVQEFFSPNDYVEVVRDAGKFAKARDATPDQAARPSIEKKSETKTRTIGSDAPRAAVISLGAGGDKNMVGMYITAKKLRELIPVLEEEEIDVVVFRVNSGGGLLYELQFLHEVIQEEYKPRFRTVAWIESAISAAAMTSHVIEEIYFMKRGNYGACTGWSGSLNAMKGEGLEQVLHMMEKASDLGGYDHAIMRAMQINEPLSATINDNGTVDFFLDTSGEILLNPGDYILTLAAEQAEEVKFSKGTTDDHRELGRLMGYNEIDWVGETVPGIPYPVSKAEAEMRKFRDRTHRDEQRVNVYIADFQRAFASAQGAPAERRGAFVNQARRALRNIERMVANNPNFALLNLNLISDEEFRQWVRDREEELRELSRR